MATRTKNVIVFTASNLPFAVELGWIREVFTFGHVTPVPRAPLAVAGVVNFHGSIVSIVDIRGLPPISSRAHAESGECGLLLEMDRNQVALRVGTIDEIASLRPIRENCLIDSRDRQIELIEPIELLAKIKESPVKASPPSCVRQEPP